MCEKRIDTSTMEFRDNCLIMAITYVNKLQAICLFKADFNWLNKLIFAKIKVQRADEHTAIPEEIFSRKS